MCGVCVFPGGVAVTVSFATVDKAVHRDGAGNDAGTTETSVREVSLQLLADLITSPFIHRKQCTHQRQTFYFFGAFFSVPAVFLILFLSSALELFFSPKLKKIIMYKQVQKIGKAFFRISF